MSSHHLSSFPSSSSTVLLPSAPTWISKVLPIPLERFFLDFWDKSMLRVNRTDHAMAASDMIWRRDDLRRDLALMVADGKLNAGSSTLTAYGGAFPPPSAKDISADEGLELVESALSSNISLVLKYEYVSAKHRPLKWVSDALFNLTGIPASLHLYVSAAGARVLKPHTDPYDVLVWQLVGKKEWRACVPREEIALASYGEGANLTDAQRCLLQELAKENIVGCTSYTVNDTHSLVCEDFTMAPGDFLYMPKGVVRHAFTDDVSEDHHCLRCRQPKIFLPPTQVHYALTDDASHSYHLTIGLHRDNRQWRDVLRHMLDDDPDETDETRKLHAEMMEIYASSIEGLHLHEAVPGWLLTCRLPWALDRASASLAGTSQGSLKHNGGAPHTLPDPQPYLCPWS